MAPPGQSAIWSRGPFSRTEDDELEVLEALDSELDVELSELSDDSELDDELSELSEDAELSEDEEDDVFPADSELDDDEEEDDVFPADSELDDDVFPPDSELDEEVNESNDVKALTRLRLIDQPPVDGNE